MSASVRECRSILDRHGQEGWVELTKRFGKTFRLGALIATCEPDTMRALLLEKEHTEQRPELHKVMGKLPGANGILFMDGAAWVHRTRALMPVFARDHVDSFAAVIHTRALAHLADWQRRGGGADLSDAVQQLGAQAVLDVGYGVKPDHPAAIALGRALVAYKQFTMSPHAGHRLDVFGWGLDTLLAAPAIALRMWHLRAFTKRVHRAVDALLAVPDAFRQGPGWIRELRAAGITGARLGDEINHLYGAFNAIDYVATAALYELSRSPTWTETIRTELRSVLSDTDTPARADLASLPNTNAFMLEVLRRYPVSMGIVRRAGTSLTIGGEPVAAGKQILVLLHALHHHPDYWDRPTELRPERWIESPGPRVPFSYVPFLDGSRKCIGRSLAEIHLLVLLNTLVRRADIHVNAEPIIPPFLIPRVANLLPFTVHAAA